MKPKVWITLAASIVSIVVLWKVPLYVYDLQRKDKVLELQHQNFLNLMVYRKNSTPYESQALLEALNAVEILHGNDSTIVGRFREYRLLLLDPGSSTTHRANKFVDLAEAIGQKLGYPHLTREDIHYTIGLKDLKDR